MKPGNLSAMIELAAVQAGAQVDSASLALAEAQAARQPALVYLASLTTAKSRQTAVEALRRIARTLRIEAWESIPWCQMTNAETMYVRAKLLEKGSGVAPSTVKLTLAILRGVLKKAFELGQMTGDAFQRATSWPRLRASRLPAGRALAVEEIRALRRHARAQRGAYGAQLLAILAVLFGGGLRREEVAALPDTALEGGALRVMGKGRKERRVPLPAWARADVEAWLRARSRLPLTAATMFVRIDGTGRVHDRSMSPWSVWNRFVIVCEDVGIDDVATHDTRRTYGSEIIEKSDLPTAAGLMGHAQISTTAGYDRRGLKAAQRAADALEAWDED